MITNPADDGQCRKKIVNAEAQYDILNEDAEPFGNVFPENKPTNGKSLISLKDWEIENGSKRNFYLIVNNIPSDVGDGLESNQKSLVSLSYSNEKSEHEPLDTVRSGESLIKHYNFDTSKYNRDTDKCAAFWRALEQTDIKPVNCALYRGSKTDREEQTPTENDIDENDIDETSMWYQALVELQQRKMDEAAFAANSQQCKFCEQEEPYSQFKKKQGQKFSENELGVDEDIEGLNFWNPKKPQRVDASTDVQQPGSVEALPASLFMELENDIKGEKEEEEEYVQGMLAEDEHVLEMTTGVCESGKKEDCSYEVCNEDSLKVQADLYKGLSGFTIEEQAEQCTCKDIDCQCMNKEEIIPKPQSIKTCDICKGECKCWERKVKMSQRFLDTTRALLKQEALMQDKSCSTENKDNSNQKKKGETLSHPCNICSNCLNVDCRHHSKGPNKYLQGKKSVRNETKLTKVFMNKATTSVSSTLTDRLSKCTLQDEEECSRTGEKPATNKQKTKHLGQVQVRKKFTITPEQRAQAIRNRDVSLEVDKYGVPQVVRYPDGRLGLKPATSEDISD